MIVKVDNKIINKDEELVDVFNDFFSSVFTNEDLSNISILDMQKQNPQELTTVNINEEDILALLNKIDINKSSGPDYVYGRILKEGGSSFSKALNIIFNRSMKCSEIPTD